MPTNDRVLLTVYFHKLNGGDVIALPPSRNRFDQSDGHDEARELAARKGIGEPVWLFWHQQAASAFDPSGNLTSPLRINWGGDHDRVAALLRPLQEEHPDRYTIKDNGAGGVFEIVPNLTSRAAEPYPDLADERAVKARVQLVTERSYQTAEADWAWLNEVLQSGNPNIQGPVAPHLVGTWKDGQRHISDEAFEALMSDWARIYGKAPSWASTTHLLECLRERRDPRLDEVIATCAKRRGHAFYSGVSHYLAKHGGPESLDTLRALALRPVPTHS